MAAAANLFRLVPWRLALITWGRWGREERKVYKSSLDLLVLLRVKQEQLNNKNKAKRLSKVSIIFGVKEGEAENKGVGPGPGLSPWPCLSTSGCGRPQPASGAVGWHLPAALPLPPPAPRNVAQRNCTAEQVLWWNGEKTTLSTAA